MTTLNRCLDFLVARPWIYQALVGSMFIFFAIAAIGRGQGYAVEVAFWGMLFWCLAESDKRDLERDLNLALKGWDLTIKLWEKEKSRG